MSKREIYERLTDQIAALVAGETDLVANAANTAAAIYHALPQVNWAGFYFLQGRQLVLGPFQGQPACIRIPLGTGVCGSAAAERRSLVVPDVHQFPGHIACDAASNSEVVVPLLVDGRVRGVLDLDSPSIGRFDDADRASLEQIAAIFTTACRWPAWIG
ncbi:MAG: GAF domain-containing protein [Thermoguttaceae bacterium]|nr:GAF domain-containing protein [Thermoguttaceae bacterium]